MQPPAEQRQNKGFLCALGRTIAALARSGPFCATAHEAIDFGQAGTVTWNEVQGANIFNAMLRDEFTVSRYRAKPKTRGHRSQLVVYSRERCT